MLVTSKLSAKQLRAVELVKHGGAIARSNAWYTVTHKNESVSIRPSEWRALEDKHLLEPPPEALPEAEALETAQLFAAPDMEAAEAPQRIAEALRSIDATQRAFNEAEALARAKQSALSLADLAKEIQRIQIGSLAEPPGETLQAPLALDQQSEEESAPEAPGPSLEALEAWLAEAEDPEAEHAGEAPRGRVKLAPPPHPRLFASEDQQRFIGYIAYQGAIIGKSRWITVRLPYSAITLHKSDIKPLIAAGLLTPHYRATASGMRIGARYMLLDDMRTAARKAARYDTERAEELELIASRIDDWISLTRIDEDYYDLP